MWRFIFLMLFLVACSSPKNDKIVVPELHAGFYSEALERINDKLASDPENSRLVDQKLFYCEQLEWPTTCISALEAYREVHGMTNQLVRQYIAYYHEHQRYQLLVEIFDRWDEEYGLKMEFSQLYVLSLVQADYNKRASEELKWYLTKHQALEDIRFASELFLLLNDTTLAVYNLGKLHELDPQNELMWQYGNILNRLGYYDLGFRVIGDYAERNSNDFSIQLAYAWMLENANRRVEARQVIKPYTNRDTIAYLLADWYRKDLMWDSASYILSTVIAKDSTNRKPIWKAGNLYDERGWFTTSLKYFEYLTQLNPNDTLAQQRIDLIQRKIAYLQRLKFEEEKIPTIELQPKKIEN
ncbi:tetratricopeptide repeat protein [Ekhidna sp.]|uniref:tetratricopeptide repeat protein n=1 Tax=Ekhidna sp. TaxID=2608089 RepID=UPI003C7BB891